MEILQILKENATTLYREDLDFFETELATGEYEESYKLLCNVLIKEIRNWHSNLMEKNESNDNNMATNVLVNQNDLTPKEVGKNFSKLSDLDLIKQSLEVMRRSDNYKLLFNDFIEKTTIINESFIDKNFTLFHTWEMDVIISLIPLSEDFLDKYISSINLKKVAVHQKFSESFFIKHYSKFDVNLVIRKGKNGWSKKDNRSKQLDVFLRLKGVKL